MSKPEVKVTVAGEKIALVLPGDGWTFEEAKLAKLVSEGMSPVEIEAGLLMSDPDAWLAVLRVSFLRADKEFPANEINGSDLLELSQAVADALKEARSKIPPTKANGSESSASARKRAASQS